jgi:hypothetical protein
MKVMVYNDETEEFEDVDDEEGKLWKSTIESLNEDAGEALEKERNEHRNV